MSECASDVGERGKGKKGVLVDQGRARIRLAVLIGLFVLALLPNFGTPATASPRATGQVVANEVSQPWPTHNGGLTNTSGVGEPRRRREHRRRNASLLV